jgi:hypothetical protein
MAATLAAERFRDRSPAPAIPGVLVAAWRGFLRRREERRTLLLIWRLGPHLVRDMGLDPDALRATVGGGWDDLRPSGLLALAPGRR